MLNIKDIGECNVIVIIMKSKIALIGFPKCGTVSLVTYLEKKYPNAHIFRTETGYNDVASIHEKMNFDEYSFVAITRDPIARIESGLRYWWRVRELYDISFKKCLRGLGAEWFHTGWQDPIGQSNYDFYLRLFEEKHDITIEKVYKFEEMIKDKDFPHLNKSEHEFEFSDTERETIKAKLNEAFIAC